MEERPAEAEARTHDPLNVERSSQRLYSMELYTAINGCQHGRLQAVEEVLRAGLSPNSVDDDGCSLLHWSSINNRVDIVKSLLAFGADPNKLGGVLVSSPLHWAARNGHVAVCVMLIKAGAVCNIRDAQGYTPVHLAIQGSHVPLVAYLLLKFDYVKDIADNSGMTPAMWCAYRSFAMFPMRLIVRSGADLNLKEHFQGSTALHIAAQERNYSAVLELLEGGADVSVRNKQQETSLDIARTHKNIRIIECLEEAARKQGHARKPWYKVQCRPPATTYFFFLLPSLVIVAIWLILTYIPLMFALLLVTISGGIVLFTVSFDFHSATYRLLPFGITIAEALLMLFSWVNYAHWYVPWWLQLLFLMSFFGVAFALIKIALQDPGIVKPRKDSFAAYMEEAETGLHPERYCFTCFVKKESHTKHCAVCNHCVNRFDHHCPWLHSCITRKNMREFVLFVFSTIVSSAIYCFATGQFALVEIDEHGFDEFVKSKVFLLVTIFLSAMHAIMLSGLLCVQLNQISVDMTTNERVKSNRARQGGHNKHGHNHSHNPFHLQRKVGMIARCQNLLEFFSTNGE